MTEKDAGTLTVCFTGHRHMEREEALRLPALLDSVIRELYNRGARIFRAGGAQGFDTVAALKVLELRMGRSRRPHLPLHLPERRCQSVHF